MIHDQRTFIALPANWEPPFFQLGEYVQSGDAVGRITGFEYFTREDADLVECASGWWYWVLEPKTLKEGRLIADVLGHHESVLQRVPSSAVSVIQPLVSV